MASSADVALKSCAAATQHARPRGRAARGPRGEPRWPELMRMLMGSEVDNFPKF